MSISFVLFSVFVCNVTGQLALGYSDSDIQQLFETNTCERCDLSRAYLNNSDLKNANLNGADEWNLKKVGDIELSDLLKGKSH